MQCVRYEHNFKCSFLWSDSLGTETTKYTLQRPGNTNFGRLRIECPARGVLCECSCMFIYKEYISKLEMAKYMLQQSGNCNFKFVGHCTLIYMERFSVRGILFARSFKMYVSTHLEHVLSRFSGCGNTPYKLSF